MKIPFKVIGLSVLSLSLLVSGCGDNGAQPLAAKDAKFAIALNLDKDQAFKIVDFFVKMASDMQILKGDDLEEVKEKIEAWKKDVFADFDSEVREFVEKSGLRDAELTWVAMSMSDFKVVNGEPRPEGFCVAIGGKLDLEKAIAAFDGKEDRDVSFEKTEIEGEKAWRIVPSLDELAKEMRETGIDPYVASLGGRLSLLALSRDTLAKQIRLYRKGEEKGDAFAGFSAAKGELLRLYLSGIGDMVKQNVPRSALRPVGEVVPNGDELVGRLQDLTIDTKVKPDGSLSEMIRLKTGSEEDADKLRTLAKTGLMALTAQVSEESETPDEVKRALSEIKIAGSDGVVEIQSGIPSIVAVAVPNFLVYRKESQKTACISNMKQIQAAVEMAMMGGIAKPTLKDLCGPDKYIKAEPKCPLGGSYIIEFTGDDYDYTITCPHADEGHELPQ